MPLQATSGAASYDAFGGGVPVEPVYIEQIFQTWLYTGDSPNPLTITNGIDLAGKGGLTWFKRRNGVSNNSLIDSVRGTNRVLVSNTTAAQGTMASITYNANGFTLPNDTDVNGSGSTYASWTFREQPKFFDVVTYTGDTSGGISRVVSHNLGSAPGCIIIKRLDNTSNWSVWHRSSGTPVYLRLNTTAANTNIGQIDNITATQFEVANTSDADSCNTNGATYVAYLFAHNAGGFGLSGTDNVISCSSTTVDGSGNATVTLGYEPQWVLIKDITSAGNNWIMFDNMRGWNIDGAQAFLQPNLTNAEGTATNNICTLTNTGFLLKGRNASSTIIYIAIRRGPMRTPTTGTSVFVPVTSSATGSVLTSNFPVDMGLIAGRGAVERGINDRLRGFANTDSGSWPWLVTQGAAAEISQTPSLYNANNTSIQTGAYFGSASAVSYLFRRAPGYFDEVCWSGNEVAGRQINHNLTVAPELLIMKSRSNVDNWYVNAPSNTGLLLDTTLASNSAYQGASAVSSTTFTPISVNNTNGRTYVAYLFASCPGVSKVGTYTGTGATQTINCGFTAGSRFVLIKSTSTTGNWYVWDSARGIVAGNDPYLELNTVNAEVTTTDWVDTAATGFELSNAGGNLANSNGVTYIFLAIA